LEEGLPAKNEMEKVVFKVAMEINFFALDIVPLLSHGLAFRPA
jgi:hypothetical protein